MAYSVNRKWKKAFQSNKNYDYVYTNTKYNYNSKKQHDGYFGAVVNI